MRTLKLKRIITNTLEEAKSSLSQVNADIAYYRAAGSYIPSAYEVEAKRLKAVIKSGGRVTVTFALERRIHGRWLKATVVQADAKQIRNIQTFAMEAPPAGYPSFLTHANREYLKSELREVVRDYRNGLKNQYRVTRRLWNGVYIEYIGGVHVQPNSIKRLVKAAAKRKLKASKKPTSSLKHVGIEIEFVAPLSQDDVIDAFADADLQDFVQVKSDGSVGPVTEDDGDCDCAANCECSCGECYEHTCGRGNSRDQGHEICVLATEANYANVLRRVGAVLKQIDAYVNKTCGLHVHLDMRGRVVEGAFSNLVRALPVLHSMVPASRRNNSYCYANETDDFNEEAERGERYTAINARAYDEHTTLEVRLHSGSINPVKIARWVNVLIKIVKAKRFEAHVVDIHDLDKRVKLGIRLKTWCIKRINKFKDRTANDYYENDAAAA